MKKNFTVNIQGVLFNIDEDAYELLKSYLESIRRHLSGTDGADEIFQDIETRIVEMLASRTAGQNNVVTVDDVRQVIEVMGKPSEIAGDADNEGGGSDSAGKSRSRPKRLFRDIDNKIIGGVSAGMAAYFNTDPIWFRLGFIVTFFIAGPLVYIAFWISMPAARSTAEKLEMKGEPVNVANIEKSIREEFNDIADKIKDQATRVKKKAGSEATRHWMEVTLGTLGLIFVRAVAILVGIILLLIGLSLATGLIAGVFFPTISLSASIGNIALGDLLNLIYQNRDQVNLMLWGIGLLIAVPALLLMHGGVKLIFNLNYRTRFVGQLAAALFVIGLVFTVATNIRLADEFRREGAQRDTYVAAIPRERPLYLSVEEIGDLDGDLMDSGTPFNLNGTGGLTCLQFPQLDIQRSADDSLRVKIVRTSRGTTAGEARKNASFITYAPQVLDSLLILPSAFYVEPGNPWRYPEVRVLLEVPVGTVLKAEEDMELLIEHGDNWLRFPSGFSGKTWLMSPDKGLVQM